MPEKKGNKSQAWSQKAAIGLKLRLNRELCLAEKRLECCTLCSEWGQPDNIMPSLSAQHQVCGQTSCPSEMSVSGLEVYLNGRILPGCAKPWIQTPEWGTSLHK